MIHTVKTECQAKTLKSSYMFLILLCLKSMQLSFVIKRISPYMNWNRNLCSPGNFGVLPVNS